MKREKYRLIINNLLLYKSTQNYIQLCCVQLCAINKSLISINRKEVQLVINYTQLFINVYIITETLVF